MHLHGGTPAECHSSLELLQEKEWGTHPAQLLLDFLSVADSLSAGHMCPVCLCHVVGGLSVGDAYGCPAGAGMDGCICLIQKGGLANPLSHSSKKYTSICFMEAKLIFWSVTPVLDLSWEGREVIFY